MILLYTLLVCVLVAARFVVARRVAQLEKKFIKTADQADHLLADTLILKDGAKAEPLVIAGAGGGKKTVVKEVRGDPAQAAKRQYQLGLIVQKRDRLEEAHLAWDGRLDRLNALIERVRAWKGRKLPYTFGVVDVSTVMYLVDRYGLNQYLNPEQLLAVVNTYFAN